MPRASQRPQAAQSTSGSARWLGCFTLTSDEGVETSFQMVVDAPRIRVAVERFAARLEEMYATTSLFGDGGDVFLDYVLKLTGDFTTPVLVNYVAQPSAPTKGVLFCDLPEQPDAKLETYGPAEDEDYEPLLTFPPKTKAAKKKPRRPRASIH